MRVSTGWPHHRQSATRGALDSRSRWFCRSRQKSSWYCLDGAASARSSSPHHLHGRCALAATRLSLARSVLRRPAARRWDDGVSEAANRKERTMTNAQLAVVLAAVVALIVFIMAMMADEIFASGMPL